MRKSVIAIVVIVVLILAGILYVLNINTANKTTSPGNNPTSQTSPKTQIIFPSGGETLNQGQTYTLKWTGGPNPTQIFLINTALESQGESVSIVDRKYNIQNTGSYHYTVPPGIQSGTYKFQIGTNTSNQFQIGENQNGTTTTSYCQPSNLQANIMTEGAAGSIYGNLTLKNTSSTPCQITGSNFTEANASAQNVTVTHQGQAGAAAISLQPNQTVYSQVRYENGPQCSGGTKTANVTFSYKISPSSIVTFQNANGSTKQNLTVCSSASEMTHIWVWSIANNPISG